MLEEILIPNDSFFPWRKKAWDLFDQIGFPQESFQYVPKIELSLPEEKAILTPPLCMPLSEAMRTYGLFLQNRLAKSVKEETDPLALLNLAFQKEGLFAYIPAGQEESLEITAAGRLMIYVGQNSTLHLKYRYPHVPFANLAIDLVLDKGSTCILSDVAEGDLRFLSVRASLKRDSKLKTHFYSEGGRVHRNSVRVQLLEENSEALLQGLWRLEEAKQCHTHALVEHLAPNTRSRQHFKGVLQGKSKSSFEGKIYVHPTAQKTEAYQLNNNLLLSDEAKAFSKPNLEIFADDVKASHGSTTAQLNAEDLFYLRARGLPLEEAKAFLVEGFCKELAECLP